MGRGVRVDGNGELKLLRKFKKKNLGGRVGGASGWGVRGRCERRSKVFVKIQKKMRGGGWLGEGGSGVRSGVWEVGVARYGVGG